MRGFIVGAILGVALMPPAVTQRVLSMRDAMSPPSGQHDPSIDERKLFLGVAWQMFNDHPLLGVGDHGTRHDHGDAAAPADGFPASYAEGGIGDRGGNHCRPAREAEEAR